MTVHLIHIGYAKTGSTILQKWFDSHPQVAYAAGGIGGYRSVYDLVTNSVRPAPGIRVRVTSSEGISSPHPYAGASLVDYAALAEIDMEGAPLRACEALNALFPNAFVLIVTRGVRAMILSSYSEYLRSSGDLDLGPFIQQAADRLSWNYCPLISQYRACFGEQNVIVLPYELLRDEPNEFIKQLEEKLGLDHQPLADALINPSLSRDELAWRPSIARLVGRLPMGNRLRRAVLASFLSAAGESRLRLLIAFLQRLWPRAPITPELISDEMLKPFAGRADCLRDDSLYAPYLSDYLLAEPNRPA